MFQVTQGAKFWFRMSYLRHFALWVFSSSISKSIPFSISCSRLVSLEPALLFTEVRCEVENCCGIIEWLWLFYLISMCWDFLHSLFFFGIEYLKIGISLISIDNNLLNLQKQTKKNMNKKSSILRIVLPTLLMLFTCLVNIQAMNHIVQRVLTKE